MAKSSVGKNRSGRRSAKRRAWVQDTTLYIEPTSNVRVVHLEEAWTSLSASRLSERLGA